MDQSNLTRIYDAEVSPRAVPPGLCPVPGRFADDRVGVAALEDVVAGRQDDGVHLGGLLGLGGLDARLGEALDRVLDEVDVLPVVR